jgi:type IV secretory pathway VirD2 relaxase
VRGKGDDGRDLVIACDYISHGLRARASHLATLELGPRSDLEIRRELEAQVEADRWNRLDRAVAREAAQRDGVVDLRPGSDVQTDGHVLTAMVGRMLKLERLGLAEPLGPGRWPLSENAEPVMRALGQRNDIVRRIHSGFANQQIERSVTDFALDGDNAAQPIIGRLVARGLDDELQGTAYGRNRRCGWTRPPCAPGRPRRDQRPGAWRHRRTAEIRGCGQARARRLGGSL